MRLDGLSILVLEDEPVIALTLEDMLLDAGAEPVIFTSLDSAGRGLAERDFDLAVLDVNVGDTNSYGLALGLKNRGIPFIFATGYGDALHGDSFTDVPTITKPYNLTDITSALETIRG